MKSGGEAKISGCYQISTIIINPFVNRMITFFMLTSKRMVDHKCILASMRPTGIYLETHLRNFFAFVNCCALLFYYVV